MTEASHTPETAILAFAPEQAAGDAIQHVLREAGRNVRVDWRTDVQALASYLESAEPAVICCHVELADAGTKVLAHCREHAPDTPLIALTGDAAQDRSALLRAGADDSADPTDEELLRRILDRALTDVARDAELAALRDRLSRMETRLDAILSESGDALATVHAGVHAHINATYADLFGFDDAEELAGVPLMDLVVPEDRAGVKQALADCVEQETAQAPFTFRGQRADDTVLPLSMRLRPVAIDGDTGVEVLVSRSLQTDDVPGGGDFAGRTALYRALESPLAGGRRGLLHVGVDAVDDLQTRLGLSHADRTLDELSAFLLEQARPGARCFRLQLGEFVLLTPHGDEDGLLADADALRQAIMAEVFGDEAASAPLTASIAVTTLDDGGGNEARLIRAMQTTRQLIQQGGNQVMAASRLPAEDVEPAAAGDVSGEQRWLQRLRLALDNDGLSLAYNPVSSLEGQEQSHWNLYARLPGEHGRYTLLSELADVAERNGLMPEIDRWMAGRVLALQRAQQNPPAMFVPVSSATVENGEAFTAWIEPRLQEGDIEPARVLFRLAEWDIETNSKSALALAERLKSLGFGMMLGDYGATGGSVALIEQLPVDFASLDAPLIESIGSEDEDPRLAELVDAARGRGVGMIAGQVRDANSMARLWQLGVHYIQSREVHELRDAGRAVGADVA